MLKYKRQKGFTIVELLIVIVIIGILAAITNVAYSGVQARGRSVVRISDIKAISKALELYKVQNGVYPPTQGNSTGGWERSAVNPDNFLSALRTSGIISKVPVDPVNVAPDGASGPEANFTSYKYYLYPAGTYDPNCSIAKGPFYILSANVPGTAQSPDSPGFKCGTINRLDDFYSIGATTY